MTTQVEYFAILTVIQPGYNQAAYVTVARPLTVGPEVTRAQVFEHMLTQLPERLRGRQDINVLFFSAEPNSLTGNRSTLVSSGVERDGSDATAPTSRRAH